MVGTFLRNYGTNVEKSMGFVLLNQPSLPAHKQLNLPLNLQPHLQVLEGGPVVPSLRTMAFEPVQRALLSRQRD